MEAGKSILFMIESNPGPGLGLLLAAVEVGVGGLADLGGEGLLPDLRFLALQFHLPLLLGDIGVGPGHLDGLSLLLLLDGVGGVGLGPLGGFDDGLGDLIGPGQGGGDHQTDHGEYHCGHYELFDCIHFTTPPKGFFLVRLSMCGVMMFISRMEKDTPSG